MTADLAQACADLAAWQPALQALTTQPDTQPVEGRSQPASRPPWNSQAANAALDIHAGARTLERDLRYAITGTVTVRGGSDANTLAALAAISKLAEAASDELAKEAGIDLEGWLSAVLQLPAVDLEQPPQRLPAPCPRPGCGRPMLRWYPARRELACLGCMVRGQVYDRVVKWADGVIT